MEQHPKWQSPLPHPCLLVLANIIPETQLEQLWKCGPSPILGLVRSHRSTTIKSQMWVTTDWPDLVLNNSSQKPGPLQHRVEPMGLWNKATFPKSGLPHVSHHISQYPSPQRSLYLPITRQKFFPPPLNITLTDCSLVFPLGVQRGMKRTLFLAILSVSGDATS